MSEPIGNPKYAEALGELSDISSHSPKQSPKRSWVTIHAAETALPVPTPPHQRPHGGSKDRGNHSWDCS